MRILSLALVLSSGCTLVLDTTGKACVTQQDCGAGLGCNDKGVCVDAAALCVPNAYEQCVGSEIHHFDSCNVAGDLVQACTANATCQNAVGGTSASCNCRNHWATAPACDVCPASYDPASDCASCLTGYDPAQSCAACLGHRDAAASCGACLTGWSNLAGDCDSCAQGYDPAASCSACLGHLTLASSCLACAPGWADVGGDDCGTCVRYVDPAATGAASGLSWTDAFTGVQAAIYAAAAAVNAGTATSCEVWVRAGSYAPTAFVSSSKSFLLQDRVGVYGGFPASGEVGWVDRDPQANPTILDGGSVVHVVQSLGNATLDGVTVQGGLCGSGDPNGTIGAGMLVDGVAVTVRNSIFTANTCGGVAAGGSTCGSGGGCGGSIALVNGGSVTVASSSFSGNGAQYAGGAIYASDGTTVHVSGSGFAGNTVGGGMGGGGDGGAIFFAGAAGGTISGSSFTGNHPATDNSSYACRGGAIVVNTGSVAIDTSSFSGNTGGLGGAIDLGGGVLDLEEVQLSSNTATGGAVAYFYGGGVHLSGGTLTARRTLFAGNSVGAIRGGGGGLAVEAGTVTLVNCIVRDNSVTGGGVPFSHGGGVYLPAGTTGAFYNSTVYGNSADTGGGIDIATTSLTIVNSIVWGNATSGVTGCCGSGTVENSDFQDAALKANPNTLHYDDPLFVGGSPFDLHLQAASTLIDAGASQSLFALVPSVDYDGVTRPRGLEVDIGAYEH